MLDEQCRGHKVDFSLRGVNRSQGRGQRTLAGTEKQRGNSAGTEMGEKSARAVGLWPELLTAGRYAAPGRVRATQTGPSPLICFDHSDTVSAKSQKSSSLLDGVVTLWRKAKGTLG